MRKSVMNMMIKSMVFALLAAPLVAPVSAQQWGTLKGKFVLKGAAPTPDAINVTKDVEVCGKHNLHNESLVVGDGGGIANVVIYLSLGRGTKAPAAHPSYAETATAEVSLDNHDCRFEPHVAAMRTTQTLNIGNKDPIGHNTKVDCVKNSAINPIVPANSNLMQKFPKAESRPVPVGCSIHPWMKGYLLIQDHPYFAVSAADGSFTIANLPVGKWEFQAWQEIPNYLTEVERGGKKEKWKKGKFEVEIKPGDNDLGQLVVDLAEFK